MRHMKGSTQTHSGWVLAQIIGVVVATIGCAGGPLAPSGVDPFVYWPEAEYRIGHWLSRHPGCPQGWVRPVINGVLIREVKPEHTCSYSPDSLHIYIDPKEKSNPAGCMAHELGHAALHQAGNRCWRKFEHDL